MPRVKQKGEKQNQKITSNGKTSSVNGDIKAKSDKEAVPHTEAELPTETVVKDVITNGVHAEEKEDDQGRLEMRIAAPWEKDEPDDEFENNNDPTDNVDKTEERRKRKSMKIRTKEKIGNIDINVLQRELSK